MDIEVTTRDIASYKRKWKDRFKEVTYSDEMTKTENDLFKHDETLLRLILRVKQAEQAVLEHMDSKIELKRNEVI